MPHIFLPATVGESDRNVVLFLDMVTLTFSSVAFLLAIVHVDALSGSTQSRFAVATFLFVFCCVVFFVCLVLSFSSGFDYHLESLFDSFILHTLVH